MVNYILQVLLFQVLFLAVYDFFLNKETFFKWNRFYLLATPILSLIISFLKFDVFKNALPQEYVVMLPEVILNPQIFIEQTMNTPVESYPYVSLVFYIGVALFSIIFLAKLFRILKIITSHRVINKEGYRLVLLENKRSAFSFFKYIFIDKSLTDKKEAHIIKHELVHCKQYHTVDLVFFEIFKIAMWFNPLIYFYQKRIALLHEYISDAEVVKETDKKSYFDKLLSETFNVENISFVNQFYKQSFIKKRIIMITKRKSEKLKQLKYLVLIPLLGGMLLYTSCERNEVIEEVVEIQAINNSKENNGFYFTMDSGDILFTGSSLKGEIVAYKDYTDKEKNRTDQFKKINKEKYKDDKSPRELRIVIDENGDRVYFLKRNKMSTTYIRKTDRKPINTEDVPFSIIEEAPVFPGCEGGTKEELKACLNKALREHVRKKFNADMAKGLGLSSGRKRIIIQFKITKTGKIEIIGARAPHINLEDEAKRVVNLLPKMIPGKQRGKPVNVTYALPIIFNVE